MPRGRRVSSRTLPPPSNPAASDPHAPRRALSFSAAVFALAAPLVYAAMRVADYAQGRTADPSLILATPHTDYYFRVGLAAWGGLLVAMTAWLAARGRLSRAESARTSRVLGASTLVLVPLLALAAWRLP